MANASDASQSVTQRFIDGSSGCRFYFPYARPDALQRLLFNLNSSCAGSSLTETPLTVKP
ncbi:MAG: hypothetical protein CMI13_07595 [Oleibacter sp.]|nr:hypothetical protein [Thalassolituus sp.]